MTISDLRLDEETWTSGNDARRAEWRTSIDDVLRHGHFDTRVHGLHVLATYRGEDVLFEALDDDGFVKFTGPVPLVRLAPLMKEYRSIIERLDEGSAYRDQTWIHTVDMAKKVVHDKAGDALADALPDFTADHPTLRLFFTLIFAIVVDTTSMLHVRHR